ncbi:unnamed protein product [Toxocara canis]|uniref:DOMON domain-containing protein n=1 Tax=Toxocara canis TaxID=6265 RepID=A0A183UAV7_TOXCA|nr:unnamed protein product [Toxocara canis]
MCGNLKSQSYDREPFQASSPVNQHVRNRSFPIIRIRSDTIPLNEARSSSAQTSKLRPSPAPSQIFNMWKSSNSIYFYALFLAVAKASRPIEQPCSYDRPDYSIEWGYDDETKRIIFSLRATTDHEEFLTGVAFGTKKHMDLLGVYVEDGKLGVIDGHITRSGIIEEDETDNADSINFDYGKGVVSAEIARTLNASDTDDVDLTGCVTFHFPSGSSVFNAKQKIGGRISKTIEKRVCDIADKCSLNNDGERKSDRAKEDSENASTDDCSFSGEGFTVEWHFDQAHESVIFDVTQNILKGKRYTAIGIGTEMKDMDMAIILLRDGVFRALKDYHANRYGPPNKDEIQDFKIHTKNTSTNERTHIQFSRKITTDDEQDASLDGCVTLQFAINAGSYENEVKIRKHESLPIAHRVCDIRSKCLLGSERGHREPDEQLFSSTPAETTSTNESDPSDDKADEDSATGYSEGSTNEEEVTTEETTTESSDSSEDSVTSSKTSVSASATDYDSNDDSGTESATQKTNECSPHHEDLKICRKYFDDYYGKVAKWAKKHNETMEAQNWKACSLLRKVAHVRTLCCNIFNKKCADYIDNDNRS